MGQQGIEAHFKKPAGLVVKPLLLPPETIAYLSTPNWTNIDIQPFVTAVTQLLGPLDQPSFQTFSQALTQSGLILLTEETEGTGFLIVSTLSTEEIKEFLRIWASLTSPTLRKNTLPDQSVIQEILVDPSAISLEETTIEGKLLWRANGRNGKEFLAVALEPGETLISNKKSLIRWYLHPDESKALSCKKPVAYVDMTRFLSSVHRTKSGISQETDLLVPSLFKKMAVTLGWRSLTIKNCE